MGGSGFDASRMRRLHRGQVRWGLVCALVAIGCSGPIEDEPGNTAQRIEAPTANTLKPGSIDRVVPTDDKIVAESEAEHRDPPIEEASADLERKSEGRAGGFTGSEDEPELLGAAGSETERTLDGNDEAGPAGSEGVAGGGIGLGRPGILGRGASGRRLNDTAGRAAFDVPTALPANARFGTAGRSGGGPVAPADPMAFDVTPTGPTGDEALAGNAGDDDTGNDSTDVRGTAGDRVALLHRPATRVTTHRVDPGPRSRGGTVSSGEGDRGTLGPVAGSLGLSPPIRLYRFRADPERGLAAHPRECHPTEILRTLEGQVNDAGGPCMAQVTEVPQAGIELASVTCILSDPTPGCRRTYVGTVWVEHQAGSFYDYELRAFGRIARQCRGRVEGMTGPADRRVTRRSAELDALFDRCGQKLSAGAGATSSSSSGR